ncbi:MAG: XdhC family protein [Chloroflexi bacterium]|nr:XdhC family protein [Chloroflexota bacterium]
MRDILPELEQWIANGEPIALATVIQTWGSSPRQAGAKMGMAPGNKITGSVSGGCIEGAVYEVGMEVLETGRAQLLHFGVADETAWEVGLACGGSVDVFVNRFDPALFQAWRAALTEDKPFAVATVVSGPADALGKAILIHDDGGVVGEIGSGLHDAAVAAARSALAEGQSKRSPPPVEDGGDVEGGLELFIEVSLPAPTLVIVGGVHIAIALASLAKTLGYRTIIVDPRSAFGSETRFPHVDRLIQEWPDDALKQIAINRGTAIAMLTHDPKLDDPALMVALPGPAFYIGALGSQKTQAKRRARLLEAGLTETQVNRIRGPIGLDLGARAPEEIALSVMAEIVAARNGK